MSAVGSYREELLLEIGGMGVPGEGDSRFSGRGDINLCLKQFPCIAHLETSQPLGSKRT